uniref:Uncharacterized protein n=1 Tax=Tetranychus urticae TaxID=32264 RepID=T1L0H7_TETUR
MIKINYIPVNKINEWKRFSSEFDQYHTKHMVLVVSQLSITLVFHITDWIFICVINFSMIGISENTSNSAESSATNNDNNNNETLLSEQDVPKKRKKTSFSWTIDKSIQLLSARKDMEKDFTCYYKGEAWYKLCRKCGFDIKWEIARTKFMNLRAKGYKKKSTGSGAEYHLSEADIIQKK